MLETPFWQMITFWYPTGPKEQTFRACASDTDHRGPLATLQQPFPLCFLSPGPGSDRRCTWLIGGCTDTGTGAWAVWGPGTFSTGMPGGRHGGAAGVQCYWDVYTQLWSRRAVQRSGKVPRDCIRFLKNVCCCSAWFYVPIFNFKHLPHQTSLHSPGPMHHSSWLEHA